MIKIHRAIAAAVFWVVLCGVHAVAQDLYVSSTGSDAGPNDCESIGSPCATIMYADELLSAGDTLHICAGACDESGSATLDQGINAFSQTLNSGTPGNPITVKAYTGETITLQGSDGLFGIGDQAINLDGNYATDWWTFEDLILDMSLKNDDDENCIYGDDAEDIVFTNIGCEDAQRSGWSSSGTNTSRWTITDGYVDNAASGSTGQGHGIYVQGANWVIDGVDCRNIVAGAGGSGWCIQTTHGGGSDDTTIRNVTMHDTLKGIVIRGDGHQIYNNSCWDMTEDCIDVTATAATSIQIEHNTFNGSISITDAAHSGQINCNMYSSLSDPGDDFTEQDNLVFSASYVVSDMDGAEDYHLVGSASAAIDQCNPGVLTAADVDGDARPGGGADDIGMDEFGGAPPGGGGKGGVFGGSIIRLGGGL
jgi:hypothetical protein